MCAYVSGCHKAYAWLCAARRHSADVTVQVPRSSKLVAEDSDLALFSVTLFKRVADGFKAASRQKGFQVWLAASCSRYRSFLKKGAQCNHNADLGATVR